MEWLAHKSTQFPFESLKSQRHPLNRKFLLCLNFLWRNLVVQVSLILNRCHYVQIL